MYIHTVVSNGSINAKIFRSDGFDLLYKMLTPSVINGRLKSTALRLECVIVKSQIAKWAL